MRALPFPNCKRANEDAVNFNSPERIGDGGEDRGDQATAAQKRAGHVGGSGRRIGKIGLGRIEQRGGQSTSGHANQSATNDAVDRQNRGAEDAKRAQADGGESAGNQRQSAQWHPANPNLADGSGQHIAYAQGQKMEANDLRLDIDVVMPSDYQ